MWLFFWIDFLLNNFLRVRVCVCEYLNFDYLAVPFLCFGEWAKKPQKLYGKTALMCVFTKWKSRFIASNRCCKWNEFASLEIRVDHISFHRLFVHPEISKSNKSTTMHTIKWMECRAGTISWRSHRKYDTNLLEKAEIMNRNLYDTNITNNNDRHHILPHFTVPHSIIGISLIDLFVWAVNDKFDCEYHHRNFSRLIFIQLITSWNARCSLSNPM